jgi:hypothetical protein
MGARRGPAAAAAAAQLRRRQEPSLDNKRHMKVLWGLGKGHGRLLGSGKQRGRSSTGAERMARWAGGVGMRRGKSRGVYKGGSAGMTTA